VIERSPETSSDLLHRIQVVTDAALSYLDTDALLRELLDRTCALLACDVAAVLSLDADAQQLVTTAAVGLEDDVRLGFRVDVGSGFAGRVAAERIPIVVDRIEPDTGISAVSRAAGIAAVAGVPMVAGGELVGVLYIGAVKSRQFSDQDVALLQLVADRAALASQASQRHADRAATLALQRSLLPTRLPRIEGVELAARYLPGHELGVGGDWYDVFVLPSGDLGIVVGDVSGHGLRSAVVMGRLRSALRSYALIEDDPANVLTFLDRKIQHFEAGNLATVLYAKIKPGRQRMLVSSAGHLPPILATPGRAGSMLDVPVDLPVGVGDPALRRTTPFDLPIGSTILLYTDGLVERPGEVIDEGLERLAGQVKAEPAQATCMAVMAGSDLRGARDDVAVLAIHTHR
jgi:serine phosphatase RsbU (regulator of sigma subunit)